MDQPNSETDSSQDLTSGRSDCDDRKESPLPSIGPSPKWALTSKPALLVLLALASWGAGSLGYQLLLLLSDAALWFLVVLTCLALVVTHNYWRPRFDRVVEPLLGSTGKESQGSKLNWKTIIAMGIMIAFIRPIWERSTQPKSGPFVPPPRGSAVNPQLRGRVPAPDSVDFAIHRNQKRQATAAYWQTAVANFHAIRFETPSGKEPFEKYQDRMFQQLRSLTNTARSAPTANVDAELVQMATRHLAVDEQYLELKTKLDTLMQQKQLPSPKDSVDQRTELTHVILNLLATNPKAIEALPAGPERDLFEKGLELEHTRQVQHREIEIMQATLQARYKGTAFLLPTISQL